MTNEEKALLDMLAFAEGTLGVSNNGYDVLVGYSKIAGWTNDTTITHRNREWYVKKLNSTAAGRYQFNYDTWLENNNNKNVPMTKTTQNEAGVRLINRLFGKSIDKTKLATFSEFTRAMDKLAPRWASIPLSSTGRSYYAGDGINHSKDIQVLYDVFIAALNIYKNQ